jgi:hypothetical protein
MPFLLPEHLHFWSSKRAWMNQHPPMHQAWMKLFWSFWDEPKWFNLNQTKHWGGLFFFFSLPHPLLRFQKTSPFFFLLFLLFFLFWFLVLILLFHYCCSFFFIIFSPFFLLLLFFFFLCFSYRFFLLSFFSFIFVTFSASSLVIHIRQGMLLSFSLSFFVLVWE